MRGILVAFVAAGVAMDSAAPRERSIYVTVEEHGRPVAGLTADNFELDLDDLPVSFRVQSPGIPANVLVLAENATATRFTFADEIRRALRSFVTAVPAGNGYALATFARTASTLVNFTDDPSRFETVYDDAAPRSSEINLSDAIQETVERLQHLPDRHVLLVLTSGADTSADRTGIRLRHLLDGGNIVVFVCVLRQHTHDPSSPYRPFQRTTALDSEPFLRSLASTTGGSISFPSFDADIDDAMRKVANTVANQYRLVFEAEIPADGELHDIDVRAYRTDPTGHRKRLSVRTKRGWRIDGT